VGRGDLDARSVGLEPPLPARHSHPSSQIENLLRQVDFDLRGLGVHAADVGRYATRAAGPADVRRGVEFEIDARAADVQVSLSERYVAGQHRSPGRDIDIERVGLDEDRVASDREERIGDRGRRAEQGAEQRERGGELLRRSHGEIGAHPPAARKLALARAEPPATYAAEILLCRSRCRVHTTRRGFSMSASAESKPTSLRFPTRPIRMGQLALRRVLRKGLRHSIRWGVFHAIEAYGDFRLGVDTSASDAWGPEAYRGINGHHYVPLQYALLRSLLRDIRRGRRDVRADVFLDFGSGKGRVVLAAARYPFKRVLGVEIVESLNEIARGNIAIARRRLRAPVEVVTTDATKLDVPDDVTVIYLYNPFLGEVLSSVQKNIERSLIRKPRNLRLYYACPVEIGDSFAALPWVTSSRALSTGVLTNHYLVVHEHSASPG
jgi:SAM-dependent methyltransferase